MRLDRDHILSMGLIALGSAGLLLGVDNKQNIDGGNINILTGDAGPLVSNRITKDRWYQDNSDLNLGVIDTTEVIQNNSANIENQIAIRTEPRGWDQGFTNQANAISGPKYINNVGGSPTVDTGNCQSSTQNSIENC